VPTHFSWKEIWPPGGYREEQLENQDATIQGLPVAAKNKKPNYLLERCKHHFFFKYYKCVILRYYLSNTTVSYTLNISWDISYI